MNYSNIAYDDFTDRFGGRVTLRTGESLLGRGGFSINHQHSWRDAAGQLVRSDVYGIANSYYEFMNGNTTVVSDTAFASSIDRLWGSIGAGGTFSWADDKYALYGEVSYRSSLNQPGDQLQLQGHGRLPGAVVKSRGKPALAEIADTLNSRGVRSASGGHRRRSAVQSAGASAILRSLITAL